MRGKTLYNRGVTSFVHWLKEHWGTSLLIAILGIIILANLRPGNLVLGNDNFSPELDPGLSLSRSIFAPAWRTYRVLGIPSDSEQADVFRTSLFWLLENVLPPWVISQGYLFFTFFIASFSMANLTVLVTKHAVGSRFREHAFLLGGIFSMASMLTSWIYFFPVHLFVAAYAFLPFVLWRMWRFFESQSLTNTLLLLVASLLLSTAALTATMYAICGIVIIVFLALLFSLHRKTTVALLAFLITLGIQAYWAFPFVTYVQSNTEALKNSAINRDITATTIENEVKHNTALNTLRYYSSWMDTKEDHINYTFPYRNWYKGELLATLLGFLPLLLALVGTVSVIRAKDRRLIALPIIALVGWFLIKGANDPFGFVYTFMQNSFPVVAQAFRWQSSKLWPFLSITMPILATLGTIAVSAFMLRRQTVFGILSRLFPFLVAACLLIFVYPYFRGGLVREKVFVRVPPEYNHLASFLKKYDSFSRIYLAPESNTLYFRNYSWGFWGSVVLNYILPNPIVEKALVIGSSENEQGFTVLTNAYYSEDPQAFAAALARYDVSFVLSDEYAATGDTGYAYNWSVHRKVVKENPLLIKAWGEGKLGLYKVRNDKKAREAEPVSFQTDFTALNTILAASGHTNAYYTDRKTIGAIYPFAQNYQQLAFLPTEVVAKLTNGQESTSYTLSASAEDLLSSPTKVAYDFEKKELLLSPLFPSLSVNNLQYSFVLPHLRFALKDQPAFMSVEDQVIDTRFSSPSDRAVSTTYGAIVDINALRSWPATFTPLDMKGEKDGKPLFFCNDSPKLVDISVPPNKKAKCGSSSLTFDKATIVEAEVRLTSNRQVTALLCLESRNHQSCLNRNTTAFLTGVTEFTTLVPLVFTSGDTLKVYLDFEGDEKAKVSIERFTLKLYQTNEVPTFKEEVPVVTNQRFSAPIAKGDTLSLHIPLFEGLNSKPFRSDGILIPESSTSPLGEEDPFKSKITITPNKGLQVENVDSISSIFPKLLFLDPRGGIAFVAMKAKHTSGVPIDISVRDVREPYKIWGRKLWYKKETENLDLFLLPQEIRSYYLEALSTGIGPRKTENTIQALFFQIIPQSWYTIQLIPQVKKENMSELSSSASYETNSYKGTVNSGITTIPTASSLNWLFTTDGKKAGDPVLVNGWKQGWKVDKADITDAKTEAVVSFGPTTLVYLGFLPLLAVLLFLGGRGVLQLSAKLAGKSVQTDALH